MTSVKVALLFVGNPTLALEHFVQSLAARLTPLGIEPTEIDPETGTMLTFSAADVTVSVAASPVPLSADNFVGSMESPLSRPVIGMLAETLARHSRHMVVSVSEPLDTADKPADLLTRLKIAHATTTLLAEWHMPAAVHWTQSNQLLSGAQYLQLASDPCPWALFAQARITHGGEVDQMQRTHGLRLDEAAGFIGRPIVFNQSSLPIDEIHAGALAFLRHTVETGTPIADGHSFGPKDGPVFGVTHVAPSDNLPDGLYELSVVQPDTDTAPRGATSVPGAVLPGPEISLAGVAAPHPRVRTRSMAISYLMLVIMPPVGAILLMSNAIFGSNVLRTGVVAAVSVVIAVIVGTYTFVNNGQVSTLLFNTSPIRTIILDN